MGGGETTTNTESRLSDELRASSLAGLEGAENLYNQGTEGIYQGSRLAEEDPLLRQAQENLLAQYGEGGGLSNLVNSSQANFQNYLNAGDLENNPLFQRQMEDILGQANVSLQRGAVPLMQQASAAGQYGGSEGQEGLGLLGGEVNRNTQQALTQAALGQQQLGLQAQGMMPMMLQTGEQGANVMGRIGEQRGQRAQAGLFDEIQEFDAARNAELSNLQQFYDFLGANPLVAEANQKTVEKTASDPFGDLMGIATTLGGAYLTGGGSLAGMGSMFGGGVPSVLSSYVPSSGVQDIGNVLDLSSFSL
tara:strand:+ start:4805 stop:5722 length:918 start_codon:yes stop_codon:yes gene_type:complete